MKGRVGVLFGLILGSLFYPFFYDTLCSKLVNVFDFTVWGSYWLFIGDIACIFTLPSFNFLKVFVGENKLWICSFLPHSSSVFVCRLYLFELKPKCCYVITDIFDFINGCSTWACLICSFYVLSCWRLAVYGFIPVLCYATLALLCRTGEMKSPNFIALFLFWLFWSFLWQRLLLLVLLLLLFFMSLLSVDFM